MPIATKVKIIFSLAGVTPLGGVAIYFGITQVNSFQPTHSVAPETAGQVTWDPVQQRNKRKQMDSLIGQIASASLVVADKQIELNLAKHVKNTLVNNHPTASSNTTKPVGIVETSSIAYLKKKIETLINYYINSSASKHLTPLCSSIFKTSGYREE